MCRRNLLKKQEVRPLLRRMEFRMRREIKVDMSAAAVTARLKRACGLGDAERLATMMRDAMDEINSGKTNPGKYPEWKRSR